MIFLILTIRISKNRSTKLDTDAPFLDLHLFISNGFVSSKIYDKHDNYDFDIVNFPFLDDDVPRSPCFGVYISQIIRFATVCCHVENFNACNKCLPLNFSNRVIRIISFERLFQVLSPTP